MASLSLGARLAGESDLETLEDLYRGLEREMTALHAMWPLADGLDEPVTESLREAIDSDGTVLVVGEVEGYPFGFLLARVEPLLAQAEGEQVGAIRLIYVDDEAREVALGETMRDLALGILRDRGVTKFDAHVLPGHRLAKNFFEAGGFAARSIVMHHDDERE
jgi:ribosomal protein S18 acetylase RimI-like enzyme